MVSFEFYPTVELYSSIRQGFRSLVFVLYKITECMLINNKNAVLLAD